MFPRKHHQFPFRDLSVPSPNSAQPPCFGFSRRIGVASSSNNPHVSLPRLAPSGVFGGPRAAKGPLLPPKRLQSRSGCSRVFTPGRSQHHQCRSTHHTSRQGLSWLDLYRERCVPKGSDAIRSAYSILDLFLAVVTSATDIGNTRPNSAAHSESVARIHEVCFYSLTSSTWDDLPPETLTSPEAVDTLMMRDSYGQPAAPPVFEHPCMPLTKILSSGSFYYAKDSTWDLSSRLSVRLSRDKHTTWDLGTFDDRFIWNAFLIRSLLDFRERLDALERHEFDTCQFIVCQPMFLLSHCLLMHGLAGLGYSRVCRGFHDGIACSADRWSALNCHSLPHFSPRIQTSWYQIQFARCGR
jgi:hypothetical protein